VRADYLGLPSQGVKFQPRAPSNIVLAVARVKVTVLSDESALSLVLALVPAFGAKSGLTAEEALRLATVVEGLVSFTLDNSYPNDDLGEIEVTLESGDGLVRIVTHDWGMPRASAGGDFGPLPEPLAALAASNLQLLNLGADGKRLIAELSVGSSADGQAKQHHVEAAPRQAQAAGTPDVIEVRAAQPEDAEAIAQLLYENYHLSYVHGDFYRPRYLMAELTSGRLVSTVALHEGRVVGHHALMPLPGVPSAETGAAVVHSAYRGLGIFGRLVERTLGEARERGLASVFGDAVTIHPFSQRAERSHGYRETALQLGMVPGKTTMRGLGGESSSRRTATLRSYRSFAKHARQVALPAEYRELLESIYANVGLSVEARAEPVPFTGEAVTTEVDEPRSLGFLQLRLWSREADPELKRAVHHLLSRHVDVVYADVDLMTVENVDEAAAALKELDFFAAGLVLDGPDGHDHLRLQLLDSEEIELDDVVCESPFAQALRDKILRDKALVEG
jgi:N-acetylglutamate synthase-like GNAT family acetyltransferase/anti-sigma regulatory factor (Ser/Thr protein kinase)